MSTELPMTTLSLRGNYPRPEFRAAAADPRTASPNPRPDPTGVADAVRAAGTTPTGFNPVFLAATVMMIAIIGFVFFIFSRQSGLALPIVPLVIVLLAAGVILGLRRKTAKTYARAWDNDWIRFYPVALGNLKHDRTETTYDNDNDKHTYYYYRCILLAALPDGTTQTFESEDIRLSSPSAMRRQGVTLVEQLDAPTLSNNNGWTLLAVIDGDPLREGTILFGLSEAQIRAGLRAAAGHA